MANKKASNKLQLPSGNGTINVKKSSIKKVTKAEGQIESLAKALRTYREKTIEYNAALKKFMTGNNGKSFWQGEAAYDWFDDAIGVLKALNNNYKDFYFCVDQFAILVGQAKALKQSKGKKIPKAFLNTYATTYKPKFNAVANMDDLLIGGVTGVERDEITSERTNDAKNCYKNLRSSLTGIQQACRSMSAAWNDIIGNTTGGIQKFAKNRAQNRCNNRVNAIEEVKDEMDNYTFDLVFSIGK